MFKAIPYALVSSLVFAGSAFAGEIGVTNSYGHSWRTGTGQTNVQWVTNSQLDEQSVSIAGKIETSESTSLTGSGGLLDGPGTWEDGDDKDKGKGNDKGSSGSGGALGGTYATTESLSFAGSLATRNYTETTNVSGETAEVYSFGASNFEHSVSTFSR